MKDLCKINSFPVILESEVRRLGGRSDIGDPDIMCLYNNSQNSKHA